MSKTRKSNNKRVLEKLRVKKRFWEVFVTQQNQVEVLNWN